MKPDEKRTWIAQLWLSSAAAMLMLGSWLGSGELVGPMTLPFWWLGMMLFAWLFRITYLAGQRRR